jgi:C1A family cysteine protease
MDKRMYGWRPDKPDIRDLVYSNICKVTHLPTHVDLRPFCSPVEDQNSIGSCTAQAIAGNLEFLEIKKKLPFKDLSRLFIYYNERAIEHTVNSDAGAEIRDGIKSVHSSGVCLESEWPYDISKFTVKPTPACYKDAKKYESTSYFRISGLVQMKSCLADGYPFVFGMSVYESFESDEVAKTGIVPMPKANEQLCGGHAVLAVGFDDTKKVLIVRNSWGIDWGDKGHFYLPYIYASNSNLADDFWTIRDIKGGV